MFSDSPRSARPAVPEIVLPRRPPSVALACEAVEAFVGGAGWGPEDVTRVTLATGEAVGNAVEHGRGADVRVRFERDGDRVELCVADDGPGPSARRLARASLPSDVMATGGRGLYILRQLAERVAVDAEGGVCLGFAPRR